MYTQQCNVNMPLSPIKIEIVQPVHTKMNASISVAIQSAHLAAVSGGGHPLRPRSVDTHVGYRRACCRGVVFCRLEDKTPCLLALLCSEGSLDLVSQGLDCAVRDQVLARTEGKQ